jgi:superfamily II DNA or RNA helicase
LEKLGYPEGDYDSERSAVLCGEACRIVTPIRLRNRLLRGEGPVPERLLIDEAHHDTASTWQQIHMCCQAPAVGFTATPFRGTPRGTAAFREQWGEPVWVLTLREAIARGALVLPPLRNRPAGG